MSFGTIKKLLSQTLSETIPSLITTGLRTALQGAQRLRTSLEQSPNHAVAVYDVINAGPRHRFATDSVIAHNCLGLGYGMSATKFNISCKSMGLTLDPLPQSEWPEFDRRQRFIIANQLGITGDLTAPRFEQEIGMFLRFDRIVQEWRQANSKVTAFWHSLEESLKKSALDQQEVHYFRLPSGRLKPYFRPRVKPEPKVFIDPETGMQKTQVRNALSAAVIKDKPATFFHGGSLAENIVQATSRDIMAQCAVDVEKLYPQCKFMWSCYDEIIFEVPEDMCEEMNKLIPEVMCHGPSISTWIDDKLPLEVEGGIFDRYCK